MRILIVGAGALGGYFGARLLDAGRDVTFLLRARRAAQLAQTGLIVKSPQGDLHLPTPPSVLAEQITAPYELVIVGSKAYDLAATMESFAPAVGPGTTILPLLNGMRHLEMLDACFGAERVLGGLCVISAALDAQGAVRHFNDQHSLVFGERDGARSARVEAIEAAFAPAHFAARLSQQIVQDMWEKWLFIASAASYTCLMRAPIGDIVEAGGTELALALVAEAAAIAAGQGIVASETALATARGALTLPGSTISASMLKDIERGAPTEADHIVGDLLARRVGHAPAWSPLGIAYLHLRAYEARRVREAKGAAQ
ncbi:MAG: 2-dehydropantoate 2-reductase [Janthinobacterium lividum]